MQNTTLLNPASRLLSAHLLEVWKRPRAGRRTKPRRCSINTWTVRLRRASFLSPSSHFSVIWNSDSPIYCGWDLHNRCRQGHFRETCNLVWSSSKANISTFKYVGRSRDSETNIMMPKIQIMDMTHHQLHWLPVKLPWWTGNGNKDWNLGNANS